MAKQTTSFTISQYILLFAIAAFCIGIVAWTMISANRRPTNTTGDDTSPQLAVTHIKYDTPCAKAIANQVAQTWAYTPDKIPMQYMTIASEYADQIISTRITGDCNDTAFTCRSGQVRRDCDPCAVGTALQIAQDQQIADLIQQQCQ